MSSLLEEIFTLLNDKFRDIGKGVLAGGCVRDTLMGRIPKDYDFFILTGDPTTNVDDKYKELIQNLLCEYTEIKGLEWHKSEPYLIITVAIPYHWNGDDYVLSPDTKLNGSTFNYAEAQILLNPCKNVEDLLSTFDWNTCMFAYDGRKYYGEDNTANIKEGADLVLNKITFPLSTLRRGFRFSERFKMKLQRKDIIELCTRIIENNKIGNDVSPKGNEPDLNCLGNNILVTG